MRVGFRTDASLQIGSGHVYRCLTLADALAAKGATCVFFCRPHDGNLMGFIAARGHSVIALGEPDETKAGTDKQDTWLGTGWETDAQQTVDAMAGIKPDWLVVDHYALDARWEQMLRPACARLMVIDDLADRPHECDLLLDQNLGRVPEDYAGLIPAGAVALLGPDYALLRPEFAALRPESLARRADPVLRRVLVTLGGVDKDDVTTRVLDALDGAALPDDVTVTVVMGPHAPWLTRVRDRAAAMRLPTEVRVGVRDMARLMADSDLSIGAGGSTTWERCALGLPSVTVVLAENQRSIAETLEQAGGTISSYNRADCGREIRALLARDDLTKGLVQMSRSAARITDGNGAARVVERMGVSNA